MATRMSVVTSVALGMLALAIFAADLATPLGVAAGVPYVAVVLIALRLPSRWAVTWAAMACLALTAIGLALSPDGGEPWKVHTNRGLAMFAISVTAWLGLALKRTNAEHFRLTMDKDLQRRSNLQALSTLAAGVSHEINNPLSFIVTNLSILRDDLGQLALAHDTEQVLFESVDDSLEGAWRIRDIVAELRTFSKSDDTRPTAVDLEAAVRSAARMAGHQFRDRARLVIDVEIADLPKVIGNSNRLCQVILNLLINSAHAIPCGAPENNLVSVSAGLLLDGRVQLAITDSGRGIAPEHLERIFEPFFTTKKVGEGMGLGLSISSSIVESFGGAMEISSVVGEGTCVRVLLAATPGVIHGAKDNAAAFKRRGS